MLTVAAVRERESPEVHGLPVVAQDPGDERAPEAAESWNQPASPMPETQSEMQENHGDRELLREADGDTLEDTTEAVAAKARGIPVMPPLAERQRHRLVHHLFCNWCAFCVVGRGCEESHRKREQRENMTPRVWWDHTFFGLGDDILVVLALREEESGAIEAAAVTEKGPAEAPVKIAIQCLEAWGLKRTVHVSEGEPAMQASLIAVKFARQEETVVTGKPRYDSKSKGLVENAHQLVQGLLRTWVASLEKRNQKRLTSRAMECAEMWMESHEIHHLGRWVDTVQKAAGP